MLIHFIHGYYCIYRPWQSLTYLYFPYCISLIYFSFTKIRMFLYARIYWLAEFGDVSCLLSLRHGMLSLSLSLSPGRILSDICRTILRVTLFKSDKTLVSDLRVWSLIHLEGSVPVPSVPITTKVVSSNPVHGKVYSIQHYVIKFVSGLRQVGGFLHQ